LRREDDRHLRGRGEFVSDIRLPGTQEVVFLRSPHAHARIREIAVPPEMRGQVFTAADLPGMQPIRIVTQASGAKSPAFPPLATDKARYVGEAIAARVADPRRGGRHRQCGRRRFRGARGRRRARRAARGGGPLVHEYWGDNPTERVVGRATSRRRRATRRSSSSANTG
jgi:carbon-monoxide dehydrogenase large subunit